MAQPTCMPGLNTHCHTAVRQLLTTARGNGLDLVRIRGATVVAARGHAGQRRCSGEPFIAHPLAVAHATAHLGGCTADVETGLLHDLLEDCCGVSVEDVLQRFGPLVTDRLLALTKRPDLPKPLRPGEAHGRLVSALGRCGTGLALVKLLDRAHNAATSAVLSPERLQRLRAENHHFFAPLAHRVGALGLAAFLVAEPQRWWLAADDFPTHMRQIQPPLTQGLSAWCPDVPNTDIRSPGLATRAPAARQRTASPASHVSLHAIARLRSPGCGPTVDGTGQFQCTAPPCQPRK